MTDKYGRVVEKSAVHNLLLIHSISEDATAKNILPIVVMTELNIVIQKYFCCEQLSVACKFNYNQG
jgi:hypothetical protein